MQLSLKRTACLFNGLLLAAGGASAIVSSAHGQINVVTVDCTPFVSPGGSSFGPQNTMGLALQNPLVDPGELFNVTEVTPAWLSSRRRATRPQIA